MTIELKDGFFAECSNKVSAQHIKKNTLIPFRDHPQFSLLLDTLSRKELHHAMLSAEFSSSMQHYFLEALAHHLAQEHIPTHLRQSEIICLNLENTSFTKARQKTIEKDFANLITEMSASETYTIFVLPNLSLLSVSENPEENFLSSQLRALMAHPKCRFLVFGDCSSRMNAAHSHGLPFVSIELGGFNESDINTILMQYRTELENFHHVVIPEELLSYAHHLAERYLSTEKALDKALLLLDSSAARAAALDRSDSNQKPVLTMVTLANVLSAWIHIPASSLQMHKFRLNEFMNFMQQKIFGQDVGLGIIGQELQQSQAHLQEHTGPLCSFLFAGAAHTGKRSTAATLNEFLFKHANTLYCASLSSTLLTLSDVKLKCEGSNEYIALKDLIAKMPYAIILLENIENASTNALNDLQEILHTGYLNTADGKQYNFKQAVLLTTTSLGSKQLQDLANSFAPENENHNVDLLHLVMNDQKHEREAHHYTSLELVDEIRAELESGLPSALCQNICIVPFLPLGKAAIERIMRFRCKTLGKTLETRYNIELGYAPEVIRFLTNEAMRKTNDDEYVVDINIAIKHLYTAVEQALAAQVDKHRPSQLFLQLNETGQTLRCDWLAMAAAR